MARHSLHLTGSIALADETSEICACFQGPNAIRCDPFDGHRLPKDVIFLAVHWYCRYPLSYRDVRDLLAERGITVDAATIYRWVQRFGSEVRKRAFGQHRSWRGLQWHVPSHRIAVQYDCRSMDESYVQVNDRRCYLWLAVNQFVQLIDFRRTIARLSVRSIDERERIETPALPGHSCARPATRLGVTIQ